MAPERFAPLDTPRPGRTGAVRALDRETGRWVALKRSGTDHPADVGPILREGSLVERLVHAALPVHVAHGLGPDGHAYLATLWREGDTLETRVAREGPLPAIDVARLGARLGAALAAMHARGVVHRDVSPANVVLEGGRASGAVLIDLGLSLALERGLAGHDGAAGTPGYVAPEALLGAPPGVALDAFSLGATLFFALHGHPPFRGDAHAAAAGALGGPATRIGGVDLGSLLERLLDPRPESRPHLAGIERAFARLTRSSEPAPVASALPRVSARLVGRTAELGALFHAAAQPGPGFVWILGTVGLGKSAMLSSLVARAEPAPTTWAVAGGSGRGGLGTLAALTEQALVGAGLSRSAAGLLALVAPRTKEREAGPVAELLAELLGVADEPTSPLLRVARTDPSLLGAQIGWAFARLVVGTATDAPLRLVVDDLDRADAGSVRALAEALSSSDGDVTLVASAREETAILRGLARTPGVTTTTITLGELSDDDAELLVRDLAPELPAEDVRRLLVRGGGSPLVLEHLARERLRGGALDEGGTMSEIVDRALRGRSAAERHLLAVVALLGGEAELGSVAHVLDAPAAEVADGVTRLVDAGLLADRPDGRLVFRQELVREAARVLDPTTNGERARALAYLEARGAADEHLAELAESAGHLADATVHRERAAQRALAAGDFTNAVLHARRGLALDPPGELRSSLHAALALAHGWTGRWDLAQREALRAFADARPGSLAWVAGVNTALFAAFELGAATTAPSLLRAMCTVAVEEQAIPLLAWSLAVNAAPLTLVAASRELFALVLGRARELEQAMPLPRVIGATQRIEALAARSIDGDLDRALVAVTRSIEALETAGDAPTTAQSRILQGLVLDRSGAHAEAVAVLADVVETATRYGARSTAAYAQIVLSEALLSAGRIDEAEIESERTFAVEGFETRTFLHGWASRVRGEIELAHGDLERAAAFAETALRAIPTSATERVAVHVLVSDVARAGGDVAGSVDHARRAVALVARPDPVCLDEAGARAALAESLSAAGDPGAAEARAAARAEALRQADRVAPALRARFLAGRTGAARALRDPDLTLVRRR